MNNDLFVGRNFRRTEVPLTTGRAIVNRLNAFQAVVNDSTLCHQIYGQFANITVNRFNCNE